MSSHTQEVANRVAAATSQGLATDTRENDLLTEALGNKEQRGRVCGVSRYAGRKAGFPEHVDMYLKRKALSTGPVDMGAIRREVRREVTHDVISFLRPTLAKSGIEIPEDF